MLEGIGVVRTLGVKYGNSGGHHFIGYMVVTNNEVYAKRFGIAYLLNGLDATVEDDNELHTCLIRVFHSLVTHTVSLVIAVGDVVVDVGVELLEKLVHQCHGSTAVYVIVSIDHNTLLVSYRIVETVNSNIHVLHQERVDEVCQLWTEETLGCTFCRYAPADEQLGKRRTYIQLVRQLISGPFVFWSRCFIIPFEVHLLNLRIRDRVSCGYQQGWRFC